ncbi:MAG TPA: hypothetical protein VG603_09900 [Chitinophagales bacterium]|nr:hypothetical protein [Chitinophagales bacterium]
MVKVSRLILLLSVPVLLFCFSDCKKDQFSTAPLSFSTDTLTFDTVFSTLGSTTLYFKVFNGSKSPVKISNIQLMHLEGTQFRINVDGVSGDHFTNVEIPGRDSIYVFVEVTVNPNSLLSPYVLFDQVNFTTGSHSQTVVLQAWGQNAYYHYGEEIKGDSTWRNDKPHVIIAKDTVPGILVDCGASLTINSGCKVFFAGNSGIFVEGSLTAVANNWQDSIIFRGVRLEQYYDDLPGQWFGIVFLRNDNCIPHGSFKRCVVNESSYGIYAGASTSSDLTSLVQNNQPVVNIDQCIIKNSQYNAVYGVNAKITASNSLFYTCGDDLVKLGVGGTYNFLNCTMYNTGSNAVAHQQPTLLLSNLLSDGSGNIYFAPLSGTFTNCVVYGSLNNEISFNNYAQTPTQDFDVTFSYSALQTATDTLALFSPLSANNILNQNPRFKDPAGNDYTPSDSVGYTSPLIDYCPSGPSFDLFDKNRSTPVDVGAIEH